MFQPGKRICIGVGNHHPKRLDRIQRLRTEQADLNPGDRHIYINARDVVQNGGTVTCLGCHQVHGDTSRKHRLVLTSVICQECFDNSKHEGHR